MTRILVLEDEKESREALLLIIKKLSDKIEVHGAATLEEAKTLLKKEEEFNLFLLDINLDPNKPEDISGIAFAKLVREQSKYEFTPIVMITSIAGLEMPAYRELHCYQYILKPFTDWEVETLIRKVMAHAKDEAEQVVVKKDGINYKIDCADIVYIKAIPRGITICLKNEMLDIPYLSLKQMIEKLPEKKFKQCHRMFVVNEKYVEYCDLVNRVIKMKGYKEPVEIGVTYKAEMREWLNE